MAADNWNQQLKELRRLDQLHAFKMICGWRIASYALYGLISNCIFMYGSGLSGWFIWHTVWSTHRQPLIYRICHSRLSSLSNKSNPLPLVVAKNMLSRKHPLLKQTSRQRGRSLLKVVIAGMAPGGTAAVLAVKLRTPPLGAWPLCVHSGDRRCFPRPPQSHEAVAFVNCLGASRQKPADSTKTLVFWGNWCGLGTSSEARKLLATSALGDIESVTLSLWTCFHPLLLHN